MTHFTQHYAWLEILNSFLKTRLLYHRVKILLSSIMGLNMPRPRSRKLDLLVPVPRQGLLKAMMGHFGGLFNVTVAWDAREAHGASVWLQPGEVREVKVDLVSGSKGAESMGTGTGVSGLDLGPCSLAAWP